MNEVDVLSRGVKPRADGKWTWRVKKRPEMGGSPLYTAAPYGHLAKSFINNRMGTTSLRRGTSEVGSKVWD